MSKIVTRVERCRKSTNSCGSPVFQVLIVEESHKFYQLSTLEENHLCYFSYFVNSKIMSFVH